MTLYDRMEERKKEIEREKLLEEIFPEEMERMKRGCCPFCGEHVNQDEFNDPRSLKEYKISSLCQACQDEMFG